MQLPTTKRATLCNICLFIYEDFHIMLPQEIKWNKIKKLADWEGVRGRKDNVKHVDIGTC